MNPFAPVGFGTFSQMQTTPAQPYLAAAPVAPTATAPSPVAAGAPSAAPAPATGTPSAPTSDAPSADQMPSLGVLPGILRLNPALAPKVPAGAARPFAPGEWVQNPTGSWSSEITVTVTDPSINGGKATVLPSLWIVNGQAVRVSEDQAAEYAKQSGLTWPSYEDIASAEAASNKREDVWQGIEPQNANTIPPLWTVAPP